MTNEQLYGKLAPIEKLSPLPNPVIGEPLQDVPQAPITSVAQVQGVNDDLTDEQKDAIIKQVGSRRGPDDLWGQIGTGAYAGLNEALGTIPDMLVKLANEKTYNDIVESRKRNKGASDIGGAAGLIGSLVMPVGLGAKAVGLGAKALGATKTAEKLGDLASYLNSSGKIAGSTGLKQAGEQLLRSGAQAATQVVPRAISEYTTQGEIDPLNYALQLGGGAVLGAGANAISGAVSKALKSGTKEVSDTLEDAVLSGADITTRALKVALNETARNLNLNRYGNYFRNADELKKKAADFVLKHNLQDKTTRENFIDEQGPLWQKITDSYNEKPLNATSDKFTDDIFANESIKDFANDPHVGQDGIIKMGNELLSKIVDKGGNIADFNQAKKLLNKYALTNKKLLDKAQNEKDLSIYQAKIDLANAIKSEIDEHALSLDPSYADLKKNYPVVKLLKIASGFEKSIIENPLAYGSDTMAKTAAQNILSGLGGAAGLGGAGALVSPDEDKLRNAGLLAAASLGAPLAKSFLTKIGTQALAGGAGAVRTGAEKIAPIAKKVNEAIKVIPKNTMTGATAIAPAIIQGNETNQRQTQEDINSEQLGFNQAQPEITPEKQGQNISYTKPQENPVYQNNVMNRLQQIYSNEGFDRDMDFKTFVNKVGTKTNNFDPKLMGKVFYDDNDLQNKYQRDYSIASQLTKLPIGKIIEESKNMFDLSGGSDRAKKELNKQQFQSLVNGGKPMSKNDAEMFDNELKNIAKLPKELWFPTLMQSLKANHGIDIEALTQLGIL